MSGRDAVPVRGRACVCWRVPSLVHTHMHIWCSTHRMCALNIRTCFFPLYFEIVFLRLNCLKRQLFIWKSDCRLEVGRVTSRCRWSGQTTQAGRSLLHGLLADPSFCCGVWLAVWFLSGVLWVLLFACSSHVSSRDGAGQCLGDSPLGYPGKSLLGKVLSPAQITPISRDSEGV